MIAVKDQEAERRAVDQVEDTTSRAGAGRRRRASPGQSGPLWAAVKRAAEEREKIPDEGAQ